MLALNWCVIGLKFADLVGELCPVKAHDGRNLAKKQIKTMICLTLRRIGNNKINSTICVRIAELRTIRERNRRWNERY
ncbi:hypothetical protein HCH_02675 [Hahella chejuensis KCTC 2396]|uniref:Uncharacterized protein n=1 Tax=Hahella chejuensis (strain KCTC 2396) TaxID=349521 RepID=Q2SIR1_HAHCH|nr:hypothetical protein HCH_02675 [Hahella chejuensis KCTC 2396]